MPFLYNKNYLFSTIKSVSTRFLRSSVYASDKSVKNTGSSAYESATLKYNGKLQILEEKLETADKIRENVHEAVVKKSAEKVNLLEKCICSKRSSLLTAGSVATGLTISDNSDVDVVFVVLDDESNDFSRDFKNNVGFRDKFMKLVGQIIRADEKIWNNKKNRMSTLYDAKVPIIKLYFGDGTKIDIQFCNHHTLKNTNLLRYYAASDPRYRKVYIYAKNLLSRLKLLDGEKGLLTSYQISVLVAHFLQKPFKNQKPILPIIPQVCSSFVSPNLSIEEVIKNLSKPVDISGIQPLINPKPLASHLAIQFIDYFAEFNFSSYAILMNKADPVEIFPVDLSPKLQLFDLYSNKSISNGDRALEALSMNLKYVRNSIKEGYFIDSFPEFSEEKFLKELIN